MKNRKNCLSTYVYAVFICLVTCTVNPVKAQFSEGGMPPSFNYANGLRSTPAAVRIPVNFSVEDLKTVNAWRVSQGAPLAVSTAIPAPFDLIEDGTAMTLPNGEKIYQLRIQAEGALALMFYYTAFRIPEGGKLYIYNATRTHVLGAYTANTNPTDRKFATEFVAGDDVIFEYVEAPSGEKPRLEIEKIGYGYDHLDISYNLRSEISGPCMVNINCEEGNDWQIQKKGVCWIHELIGNQGYVCSGSLINNTAQDMTPYVLSAFHCTSSTITQEELDQWIFYFNDERTGCSNNSRKSVPKTITGCSEVAYSPIENGSDGLLLLLHNSIPESYDVFFNGWDRRNTAAQSGVGIHHPGGDFKKISTYGNVPVISATWTNSESQLTGSSNAHWLVIFDPTLNGYSVTEGGSSGSPLFNENKLIVGTLSGGNSACDAPDGVNLYGKLYFHWNKYSEDNRYRMDKWLDPLGTGATVLNGISRSGEKTPVTNNYIPPVDVRVSSQSAGNMLLNWEAPVYKKNISWTTGELYGYYGFDGTPFYFGQRWKPDDLKNFHKKTITAVSFRPVENAKYAVYIRQDNRVYEQDIERQSDNTINTIQLKTPFIINAAEDLIVGLHVTKHDKYAVWIDNGPLVLEKGNLYSEDGEKWFYATKEELDNNAFVYATVTSENGELPTTLGYPEKSTRIPSGNSGFKPVIQKAPNIEASPMASDWLDAFPEISGYNIYRNKQQIATLPATQTSYTDKQAAGDGAVYQVSARYGDNESILISAIVESSVGNMAVELEKVTIYPAVFTDQVRIENFEKVKIVDIYSISGKRIARIQSPEETLNTAHLPQGNYIFLLHTDKGIKSIRALKQQ